MTSSSPGDSFPFDAFPPLVKNYAEVICRFLQVAQPIVGSALLSVVSLLVQSHREIKIDFRSIPLSLATLIVADSGERKTTVDKILLEPIRKMEKELFNTYPTEKFSYTCLLDLWKKETKDLLMGRGSPPDFLKPELPPHPKILMQEPTIEGITRQFEIGWDSLGLFSDEGAKMLGGYSMGSHKEMHSAGHLSSFWDGTPIERTRAVEGKDTLFDKRLTVCLMIQNIVFERVWNNIFLQEQGLLARFLICQPTPKAGTRVYHTSDRLEKSFKASQKKFNTRMNELLAREFCYPKQKEVQKITLSTEALQAYKQFSDTLEKEIVLGGDYYAVKAFAAKTAEQSLRIAACLHLFEKDSLELTKEVYERGATLAKWYLDETLRITCKPELDPHGENSQYILKALESRWQRKKTGMTLREITHTFPITTMRKKSSLLPILETLVNQSKIKYSDKMWYSNRKKLKT